MREPGFVVTVGANTVLDAVSAYGLLHRKTEAGRLLHLYRLRAIHAGAFAAVWMLYNVPIEAVSTAIALATSGRELAELTCRWATSRRSGARGPWRSGAPRATTLARRARR